MKNEKHTLGESAHEPVVAHPRPISIEELLRYVDPTSDEEIERFVATIYADRRAVSAISSPRCPE